MKKYILVLSAALFTTAAVTATVLSNHKATEIKKKRECTRKMDKKQCTQAMKQGCTKMQKTNCFQGVL